MAAALPRAHLGRCARPLPPARARAAYRQPRHGARAPSPRLERLPHQVRAGAAHVLAPVASHAHLALALRATPSLRRRNQARTHRALPREPPARLHALLRLARRRVRGRAAPLRRTREGARLRARLRGAAALLRAVGGCVRERLARGRRARAERRLDRAARRARPRAALRAFERALLLPAEFRRAALRARRRAPRPSPPRRPRASPA